MIQKIVRTFDSFSDNFQVSEFDEDILYKLIVFTVSELSTSGWTERVPTNVDELGEVSTLDVIELGRQ